MADESVPDIEWVDEDSPDVEWVGAQPKKADRKGFFQTVGESYRDAAGDALRNLERGSLPYSPQSLVRLAGEEMTAAAARAKVPGAAWLYERQTGEEFLTPEKMAALRQSDPREAKRRADRQMSIGGSILEGGKDLVKVGGMLADGENTGDELKAIARELPGVVVGETVRTAGRGGIRREAPLSSLADMGAITSAGKGLTHAASAGARSVGLPVTYATGRAMEEVGRGFGLQSLRARNAEQGFKARQLDADAALLAAKRKNLPGVRAMEKAKRNLDDVRHDMQADEALKALKRARQDFSKETTHLQDLKHQRADWDPHIHKAARAKGNMKVGKDKATRAIDDEALKLNQYLREGERTSNAAPVEAAKARVGELKQGRKLMRDEVQGELLDYINASKYTPKVERGRDAMYAARKVKSGKLDKGRAADDVWTQKYRDAEDAYQAARKVGRAEQDVIDRSLDYLQPLARQRLAEVKAERLKLDDATLPGLPKQTIPSRLTSWGLRKLSRANMGEKNLLDESVRGAGSLAIEAVKQAAVFGAGAAAQNAATMEKWARMLIRNGRSIRQTAPILQNVQGALAQGGRAAAIASIRGMMDAGELLPEEAADMVQGLAQGDE